MTTGRTRYDLDGIYTLLNIKLPNKRGKDWINMRCPVCGHGRKKESFGLRPSTGHWKCHRECGKGNIVALAAKIWGVDGKEAFKRLKEKGLAGKRSDVITDVDESSEPTSVEAKSGASRSWKDDDHPWDPTAKRMKRWRKYLRSSKVGKAWLEAFGITMKTARQFRLGYGRGDRKYGDVWGEIVGYRYCRPHLLIPHYQNGLLEAVWVYRPFSELKKNRKNGKLRIVQKYEDAPKQLPIRKDMGSHLLGPQHIPSDSDCILVCEGLKDMLVAWSHGFVAVAGSAGAKTWLPEWSQELVDLRPRSAIIVYDHDRPGRIGAVKVARSLHRLGLTVAIARWPAGSSKGYDLADWFNKSGKSADDLKTQILSKAKPYTPPPDIHESFESQEVDTCEPKELADIFLSCMRACRRPYRWWRQQWYRWNLCRYELQASDSVRNMLWRFLPCCYVIRKMKDKKTKKFLHVRCFIRPAINIVNNVEKAFAALSEVPHNVEQPQWLSDGDRHEDDAVSLPVPGMAIAFQNGILDVQHYLDGENVFLPSTPRWFSTGVSPYGYNPKARCPRWIEFLGQLWPDDPDAIRCLQEWVGHLLIDCTRFQKILFLIGCRRSGKGTIARVIQHLVGPDLCAWPTMASLQSNFSLDSIYNRRVAIIPDAHVNRRQDTVRIMEVLKSISGEDVQRIEGKYRDAFYGRMQARLMLLSNEIIDVPDHAGALSARFMFLRLTISFEGREDKRLTEKLIAETPGICNWALRGLRRLLRRGRFTMPACSKEMRALFDETCSPIKLFFKERCKLEPNGRVPKTELFEAFQRWAESKAMLKLPVNEFGKQLHAAIPDLTEIRPRIKGKAVRCYLGIELKADSTDE